MTVIGARVRGVVAALLIGGSGCQVSRPLPTDNGATSTAVAAVVSESPPPALSAIPAPSASSAPAGPAKPLRMAFVGDVSTSMVVRDYIDGELKPNPPVDADYPFHFVRDRLVSYDLLVGNLECVASVKGTRTRRFPLQCSMKTGELLKDAGFRVLSVANNHQNDMGTAGYEDEVALLRGAGFKVCGDYLGSPPRDAVLVDEVDGIRVAIVGIYNRKREEAVADVARARKEADVVLAFMHWGDDFHSRVSAGQRALGHAIVDAGADAVIGAHAHVVQPEETYDGKLIAYGLGNFVFTGMNKPGTHNGALLELDVDKSGVVAHRYRRLTIDEQGTPRFASDEATSEPFVDPPLSAPQNEPVPVPATL